MRTRDKVVAVPVLLERVRGPVAVIRSNYSVVVDGVDRGMLLRGRQAIGAGRSHRVAGGRGQDTTMDDLVRGLVGTVRGGHCRQSKDCEQEHGGGFVEGDHLEFVQFDGVGDGMRRVRSDSEELRRKFEGNRLGDPRYRSNKQPSKRGRFGDSRTVFSLAEDEMERTEVGSVPACPSSMFLIKHASDSAQTDKQCCLSMNWLLGRTSNWIYDG
jgi:hypothetical protein